MPASRTIASKPGSKRRAPMSCDRCKSRKTKCVDPVPGPCRFCASIHAVCHLDPSRRRQRPYYHVSEEEFRYMTRALEHFLPDVELSLPTLRDVVQSFDAAPARGVLPLALPAPPAYEADAPCPSSASSAPSSSASSSDSSDSAHDSATPPSSTSDADAAARMTLDEIDELHGALGWLHPDARGTYRHVGAASSYGFHVAVRALHQRDAKPDLPSPAAAAAAVAAAVPAAKAPQIFLPRRDLCNRCVARFFRDVQSVYWFWSAERLHSELDRLYAGDPASATPALLGSLYAVLALTCESEAAATPAGLLAPHAGGGPPPATRYLALAKALAPALCDVADPDSVRALCLLALALQQAGALSTTTAYVYVGAAARIALTLGLHVPRAGAAAASAASAVASSSLQRQVDVRLYATLFLLDTDVALCYGNPPAISDAHAATRPLDLSEQILSPGSYMPLDYLTVACELTQIRRRFARLLYRPAGPACADTPLTVAAVRDGLAALHAWHAAMPSHLRDVSRAASFHQRSVSVLHLRYWSTVLFATRPFLLYSGQRRRMDKDGDDESLSPPKRAAFAAFCAAGVDAARQALHAICFMRDARLLSSLVPLDAGCVVEIIQVLLLARLCRKDHDAQSAHDATPPPDYTPDYNPDDDIRTGLHILQDMEPLVGTRHVLAEVRAQLLEAGLLGHGEQQPHGSGGASDACFPAAQKGPPSHFFLDEQEQQQQDLMAGMDSYLLDLNGAFFAAQDDVAAAPLLPESF